MAKRGRKPYIPTPEIVALLGVETDLKVAEIAGVCNSTIAKVRTQMGIERWHAPPKPPAGSKPRKARVRKVHTWESDLGLMSDCQIAKREGVSRQLVQMVRKRLGIDRCPPRTKAEKVVRGPPLPSRETMTRLAAMPPVFTCRDFRLAGCKLASQRLYALAATGHIERWTEGFLSQHRLTDKGRAALAKYGLKAAA